MRAVEQEATLNRYPIQPRFDNGRAKHAVEMSDPGAVFRSDGTKFILHTAGRRTASEGGRPGNGSATGYASLSRCAKARAAAAWPNP